MVVRVITLSEYTRIFLSRPCRIMQAMCSVEMLFAVYSYFIIQWTNRIYSLLFKRPLIFGVTIPSG
jgi:hypothetical protein